MHSSAHLFSRSGFCENVNGPKGTKRKSRKRYATPRPKKRALFTMETSESGAMPEQETADANPETVMNLALLDPPRFGWSAIGGIVDVLPPHDVSPGTKTT